MHLGTARAARRSFPLPFAGRHPDAADRDQAAEGLRGNALFGGLASEDQWRLQSLSTPVERPAGSLLFEEGDAADQVYLVATGVVQEYKMLPDGRRLITAFHYPGDLIGMSFGEHHGCSAEAVTDAVLRRHSRRGLAELNERLPGFGRRLLSHLSDELKAVQAHLLLLGRKTAVERVASFLVDLAERAERGGRSASPLWLPMRREAIGDHLGLTLETVSRVFSRLRRDGLISAERNGWIELLDRAALAELAEGA